MILCKKCGFGVGETMRFALKSNTCPSCGSTLFGDKQMQEISSISGMIRAQAFSQSLSDDSIFDISLFILDNFQSEKNDVNEILQLDDEENKSEEDDISRIRDEVRDEAVSAQKISEPEVEVLDDSGNQNEDDDMKISRLKRMAQMSSKLGKAGVSVRRVTT